MVDVDGHDSLCSSLDLIITMFIASFEPIKQQSSDFVEQHLPNDWYTLTVLKFVVELLCSFLKIKCELIKYLFHALNVLNNMRC